MSRNSFRLLTLAVVLIVGLGMALPAAARPAERVPVNQDGLFARLWDLVEDLWRSLPQPDKDLRSAKEKSGGCDRGILIDPNGSPCND